MWRRAITALINPEHLLLQAEKLTRPEGPGAPLQANLRRAVSTAYYALFHFTLHRMVAEILQVEWHGRPLYALLYRSVDHRTLFTVCEEVIKTSASRKYRAYLPVDGFCSDVRSFASAALELQAGRHDADYNPHGSLAMQEARALVRLARGAIQQLKDAPYDERKVFLMLLLCPPR